jgi:hypothetical protein
MSDVRLRDLDPARWQAIANEIQALVEEIVDRDAAPADWPRGAVGPSCCELLTRASIMASFAALDPLITASEIQQLWSRVEER